jgi:hypothetical protein
MSYLDDANALETRRISASAGIKATLFDPIIKDRCLKKARISQNQIVVRAEVTEVVPVTDYESWS